MLQCTCTLFRLYYYIFCISFFKWLLQRTNILHAFFEKKKVTWFKSFSCEDKLTSRSVRENPGHCRGLLIFLSFCSFFIFSGNGKEEKCMDNHRKLVTAKYNMNNTSFYINSIHWFILRRLKTCPNVSSNILSMSEFYFMCSSLYAAVTVF